MEGNKMDLDERPAIVGSELNTDEQHTVIRNDLDGNKEPANKKKRCRMQEDRTKRDLEEHPLMPGCNTCKRKKCPKNIGEEVRSKLNSTFWKLDFTGRRHWFDSNILIIPMNGTSKSYTLKYFLPKENGSRLDVCKSMFLSTLGLSSDKRVSKFIESKTSGIDGAIAPKGNLRGKRTPVNKSDVESIMAHINSYHPVISHYNRKNAPNCRYLDPELTEKNMWEEYNEKILNKEEHIGYTTFCSYFKKMNIGFKKPGQDDCQDCVVYHDHMLCLNLESEELITPEMKKLIECIVVPEQQPLRNKEPSENKHKAEQCDICIHFMKHKTKFDEARIKYQKARGYPHTRRIHLCC